MSENIIDDVNGTVKTIKVVNKETKEEETPRKLLNDVMDKVEKSLNLPGNNTIKNIFKVLIDIMAADYIIRLMPNMDQTTMALMFKKEVLEGITRFGLATMLLYPHLIEKKLELKPEIRDMTEEEITSIGNIKKSVMIVTYLSCYGINPLEIMSVFMNENILSEKELSIVGLTDREISVVKEKKKTVDQKVRDMIMKIWGNYDAIVNGQNPEAVQGMVVGNTKKELN